MILVLTPSDSSGGGKAANGERGEPMLNRCSAGIMFTAAALAQAPVMPQLTNGPAKPGFDIARFSPTAVGTFNTFYLTETRALKKVLAEGMVAPDTAGYTGPRNRDGGWQAGIDYGADGLPPYRARYCP
jgi:hypothetical protein